MPNMIEVPGEASPLSQANVLNALLLAASSTQQQVQTGTKQLQHWEKQKLYYPTLQVFSRHLTRDGAQHS
jgi:hypothetical protein